jgi:5-methylcytosine-specific restriction endonuclease McrA
MSNPQGVTAEAYEHYLASPEWLLKRKLVLDLMGERCYICGSGGSVQVHHNTYVRLGRESLRDLVVLCRDCHMRFHKIRTSKAGLFRISSKGTVLR